MRSLTNWVDPTKFISAQRKLKKDWRKHPCPPELDTADRSFKGI